MIGLRVNYKYFEQDDPQLFLSKIKFIEDNDVSDMDLTFSEEEYDDKGQLIRVNVFSFCGFIYSRNLHYLNE